MAVTTLQILFCTVIGLGSTILIYRVARHGLLNFRYTVGWLLLSAFGVMAGISFFLLNNLFGHMGQLQNWQPWLSAALPGLIYSLLSLGAFGWLVLRH